MTTVIPPEMVGGASAPAPSEPGTYYFAHDGEVVEVIQDVSERHVRVLDVAAIATRRAFYRFNIERMRSAAEYREPHFTFALSRSVRQEHYWREQLAALEGAVAAAAPAPRSANAA